MENEERDRSVKLISRVDVEESTSSSDEGSIDGDHAKVMDIDDVYRHIGEFGRYQIGLVLLMVPYNILLSMEMVHNVFIAAEPEFYCQAQGGTLYTGCPDAGIQCTSYVYNISNFTSVVSEWDLVCEKAYKLQMIQSAYMLGVLVGSLTILPLSDKYGRLKVAYVSFPLVILLTFGGGMSYFYNMYIALRFFVGMFTSALGMVGFVLPTELVGPSKRGLIGILMGGFFAVGIAIFALVAFYITDWRMLSVACAIVGVVAFTAFFAFPESPRWLQSQGRTRKAEIILERIASVNKQRASEKPIHLKHISRNKESSTPSTFTLFTHSGLRLNTLINIFVWFTVSLGYYGLTMSAGSLGNNMYISVALSGLVELPAYLIAYPLMNRIGRKKTLSIHLLVGGVACMGILLLSKDMTKVVTTLAMIGKMASSAAFSVAYVFSAELLPTVIRNTGMGLLATAARIGGIVAPMVIPLDAVYPSLQFLVFGSVSFVAGVICLKLPETMNQPLPETMNDIIATHKPSDRKNIVYQDLKEETL